MTQLMHKFASERHERTAHALIETEATLIGSARVYKPGVGYTDVDSPFRPDSISASWTVNDAGTWQLTTCRVNGRKLKKDGQVGVRLEQVQLVGELNGRRELDTEKVPEDFYEMVRAFVRYNWPTTLVDFHPSRRVARAQRVDELHEGEH